MQQLKKIIISGGGTGGHIFPAIAIANALKLKDANIEILFVGALGKMEMEKVPQAGYKIIGLPIAGIKREMSISNLFFPLKVAKSLLVAKKIINDFKPDIAVGVGGYASGPLLFAASLNGIPTLIQEQNSFPGITNKLLSKKASKICVAYNGMEIFFSSQKLKLTGNPVREDIKDLNGKRELAMSFFNLDASKKTILIVGGSQGARSINKAIVNSIDKIETSNAQVIWQTGKLFFEEAQKLVIDKNVLNIRVFEFISKMDYAYAACDLVISRAGASTVSELALVQKPAIMVPLSTAAEDHQTKNCKAMVQKRAAILITDSEANDKLVNTALELLYNETKLKELSENIKPLAKPYAAQEIAHEILNLIK